MKSILITGCNGFIGNHLVKFLQSQNFDIIGVSTNHKTNQNIKHIKKSITKLNHDDIKNDVDCIIHLAAMTDVDKCKKKPLDCIKTNVLGTQKMLEIARKKSAKLLYLSSSHVYGVPIKIPITEEDPTNPVTIYGASKLSGEILCKTYSNNFGLDISILRFFSVYGPNDKKNSLISKIACQIKNKKNLNLGNLYPKRDFLYVDDAIDAIQLTMKNCNGFNTYNVGAGKSYSISEICKIFQKIVKRNISINSVDSLSRKNEISKIMANNSKLRKLGWKPTVCIEDGLQKVLESS